jgi:hypothetical protein
MVPVFFANGDNTTSLPQNNSKARSYAAKACAERSWGYGMLSFIAGAFSLPLITETYRNYVDSLKKSDGKILRHLSKENMRIKIACSSVATLLTLSLAHKSHKEYQNLKKISSTNKV